MASANDIRNLLFDWDGTLMDSARLGFRAFQKTFSDLGIPFHQEVYEAIYSPNWYQMYEALKLPRPRWETADKLWMQHYGEEPARLVDGGRETLTELNRRGYRMGIVSSGTCSRVHREISDLRLADHFEVVVCNEDMVNKKPHPEGLQTAMRKMQVEPGHCSYVGDSPEDIEMGRGARVFTIGVLSAYPTSRKLPDTKPDIYLDRIDGLLDHF